MAVGCHDSGPWCKAAAVAAALAETDARTLIISDADVWCDGLPQAVQAVQAVQDGAAWVVPHRGVHRLTEAATAAYMAGEPLDGLALDERAYLGIIGGGITVLRREVYEDCPLDPRFQGWGSEDESWGFSLTTLHGPPTRLKHPLAHLWHPPQPRMTRSRGNPDSWQLRKRYARAINHPDLMRNLIEEAKAHDTASPPEPAGDTGQALRLR